jgi:hypothetical protein
MNRTWRIGGISAGIVLIAFGIATVALAAVGAHIVNSNLKQQFITGTPDMTPSGIQSEIDAVTADQAKIAAAQKKANVPPLTFTTVKAPHCSVAGKSIDNGNRAQCFAQYMRIHALGATNGLVYAQMGQYAAKPDAPIGKTDFNGGTNDTAYAETDPTTGQPVSNGTRNLWISETALTGSLYLAFTGTAVSLFGIVVGIALLLTGVGFLVLVLAGPPARQPAAEAPAPSA